MSLGYSLGDGTRDGPRDAGSRQLSHGTIYGGPLGDKHAIRRIRRIRGTHGRAVRLDDQRSGRTDQRIDQTLDSRVVLMHVQRHAVVLEAADASDRASTESRCLDFIHRDVERHRSDVRADVRAAEGHVRVGHYELSHVT
jgi:uncharacterized protein YdiU (UPF0061 family)